MVSKNDTILASSGDDKVSKSAITARNGRAAQKDADLGNALRSVYQRTVAEQVPPEMLDLLGKLD